MSVTEKLSKSGPRKLLALDGGGIRGIVSLEVLAEIERLLQRALGRDDSFVLAEYFDYIAGTSTGAIIATCLSLGMRVDRIRHFYESSAREIFSKAGWRARTWYKYDDTKLRRLLQEQFGPDTTLGSDRLQTLLLLIVRNASTNSPWPITNNPLAKYNDPQRADSNLRLPLWKTVRASAAAPSYFAPEVIELGDQSFVFVDGGVTPYNNPAFQLFLMATISPYALCWPTGEDKMLLVSVGTGGQSSVAGTLTPHQMTVLYQARSIPNALVSASMQQQDLLCRVFGKCLVGDPIDREVGALKEMSDSTVPRLFTYMRFDADLSAEGLLRLGLPQIRSEDVLALDSVDHVAELELVGQRVAQQVQLSYFADFLQSSPTVCATEETVGRLTERARRALHGALSAGRVEALERRLLQRLRLT